MNLSLLSRRQRILEEITQATWTKGDRSILEIRVKPNAKTSRIYIRSGSGLNLQVRAPAKSGKANAELQRYIARELLGIPQSKVHLTSGINSRHKRIEIEIEIEELRTRIHRHIQPKTKL